MSNIKRFFQNMIKGEIGTSKELSFNIIVQDLRRREMIQSLLKERRANTQLLWCKENNFEPEQFETPSAEWGM